MVGVNFKVGLISLPFVKASPSSSGLIIPFLFWSTLSKYVFKRARLGIGGGGAGLFGVTGIFEAGMPEEFL